MDIDQVDMDQIIKDHANWLVDHRDGKQADLTGADLTGADLTEVDLTRAYLTEADLSGATLSGAGLTRADLTRATLTRANLSRANLTKAYLTEARLTEANLSRANLSGAKGLTKSADWLRNNFARDREGILVFKAFGDTYYYSPPDWIIEPGSFIEETVNPSRTTDCGCGVNFATLAWIQEEFGTRGMHIFKCRIHWIDLADTVVPYNTDGKARCARLELLEEIN